MNFELGSSSNPTHFKHHLASLHMRLSQFISDRFQSTQRLRTIATFFDFGRAYDRVWYTGLLIKMSKMCVPRRFTEWQSSWFINRTARVRENGSIGPSRTFKDGSTIIFTIYIDDLLAEFEKNTFVSAKC